MIPSSMWSNNMPYEHVMPDGWEQLPRETRAELVDKAMKVLAFEEADRLYHAARIADRKDDPVDWISRFAWF